MGCWRCRLCFQSGGSMETECQPLTILRSYRDTTTPILFPRESFRFAVFNSLCRLLRFVFRLVLCCGPSRWEFRIPHRARTTKSRVNVVPWQGAKKSPQAYKNGLREDQAALPRVLPTGKQSSRRLKPRQWPELGKGTYVVVVQVRLLD